MPTEDLLVRPGGPDDAAELAEIVQAARRAAPMPAASRSGAELRQWLAERLARDEVWVAEREGVVGYARLVGDWLDDLYVAPRAARQGIGRVLLDTVKAQRPGGFQAWVFETNGPARRFYAAQGLVELELTDGTANEEQAPDLRVAWPGAEPLAFLRGLVDEVDDELGDLLARRAALTAAIQPHKRSPERDPVREAEVARRIAARAHGLSEVDVARIVDAVIEASLRNLEH